MFYDAEACAGSDDTVDEKEQMGGSMRDKVELKKGDKNLF